ncbi:hypothetical protein R0K04_19210 [Pseudoalteromonas sp. SIMBA_153]
MRLVRQLSLYMALALGANAAFAADLSTVEALRDILDNRLWDTPAHKVRGAVT